LISNTVQLYVVALKFKHEFKIQKMKNILFTAIALLLFQISFAQKPADEGITVRKGFKLTVVQSDIKSPRMMQLDTANNILYVSLPNKGEVKACRDKDGDGYYETVTTFLEGHKTVHGLYFYDGWLWFAETGTILKARDTNDDGVADEKETIIKEGDIPKGGGHWWRPILIHNNRIYTAIGCSGNINDEVNTERLKIFSFALDGSDKKEFADGLRNTEKLVIRPKTDEIWGMDHGSDWFGRVLEETDRSNGQPITDMNPAGEMNHYEAGNFYGHPYITGNRLPRYEYMERRDIVEWAAKTTVPAWSTGAHWAPNAMEFYTGSQFPSVYFGDAFVAFHGSWNRSERSGYCVSRVLFDEGKPYGELKYVNFIDKDGKIIGRPVDVENTADGSLLISDDYGDTIYKLEYIGE
jgi:glucose/arabinose dehydrogenase